VHSRETEEFTVLDGRLWVRIGRRRLHLEQGESASIPPGTVYAFANRSDAPVSFRAVSTLPPQPLRGTGGTPAGILEQMVRLQAQAGRTPLLRIARLNQGEDQTFFLPGLPRPPSGCCGTLSRRSPGSPGGSSDAYRPPATRSTVPVV
jgi:hypothetical protein